MSRFLYIIRHAGLHLACSKTTVQAGSLIVKSWPSFLIVPNKVDHGLSIHAVEGRKRDASIFDHASR
jgi:hypothetical protein